MNIMTNSTKNPTRKQDIQRVFMMAKCWGKFLDEQHKVVYTHISNKFLEFSVCILFVSESFSSRGMAFRVRKCMTINQQHYFHVCVYFYLLLVLEKKVFLTITPQISGL